MSGELDLQTLLNTLEAKLAGGVFVFVTLPHNDVPDNAEPLMRFQEAEGTTLIMTQNKAEYLGLVYEFPCRMITLNIHSSLEAVGFIAHIATELAKHGMGVNPVAGFYHDHIFVPLGREEEAMEILAKIPKLKN